MKINLLDSNFSHCRYTSLFYDNDMEDMLDWNRENIKEEDFVLVTDNYLNNCEKYPNKSAWLIEPRSISPEIYKSNFDKFKSVYTYDEQLLRHNPEKFKFIPAGGCWIEPTDQVIHNKTKILSIIASYKNQTNGQGLRHRTIQLFGNRMDVFGGGYKWIESKILGLKDYMFQIAIENGKYDYYFTEKIIDCFRTGTVPIYWGCPSIGDFFDERGIIQIENPIDLYDIIDSLNKEKWESMYAYIEKNYHLAEKYLSSEKYIVENKLL